MSASHAAAPCGSRSSDLITWCALGLVSALGIVQPPTQARAGSGMSVWRRCPTFFAPYPGGSPRAQSLQRTRGRVTSSAIATAAHSIVLVSQWRVDRAVAEPDGPARRRVGITCSDSDTHNGQAGLEARCTARTISTESTELPPETEFCGFCGYCAAVRGQNRPTLCHRRPVVAPGHLGVRPANNCFTPDTRRC